MLFSEINPFLRFVRFQSDNNKTVRQPCRCYDARFFYTMSGNGKITADGNEYIMKKGSALFINAGVQYYLHTPENEVCYCAVNFDYTYESSSIKTAVAPHALSLFDEKRIISKAEFSDMPQFNRTVFFSDISHFEGKIIRCEKEFSRQLLFYDRKISGIFIEIIIGCARLLSAGDKSISNRKIENILTYLHENYNQNITNEELSHRFLYHPNYLSSMIKNYTGLSLHKYLIQLRLLQAAKLLETRERSIGEIAEICGFCDIYHFSKCFKKEMGVSPAGYRKTYWGENI